MFASPPALLAGTKRLADNATTASQTISSGLTVEKEYRAEHIDPRTLCCCTCPEQSPCEAVADPRPVKRRASASKVLEFHNTDGEHLNQISNSDHQFLDTCFDKFCQGCDFDPTCSDPCPDPCPLPCPGDDACSPEDACWDPHCDQGQCFDHCVDPDCTKVSCPNDPCFCQKCDTQSCPLGDPDNECHQAHSAPTDSGTIFCFDNAPCHFKDGQNLFHPSLPACDGYQCFSQAHRTLGHCNVTSRPSNTATPALSPDNYTSLGSFSKQPSPMPSTGSTSNCFLNIPFDHCHINQSCCHGTARACEDFTTAPQEHLDMWDSAVTQSNGFDKETPYQMFNFGFQTSQPQSTLSFRARPTHSTNTAYSGGLSGGMLSFDNSYWMLPDSHFPDVFPESPTSANNKLDYLASAIQNEVLKPVMPQPKKEPLENSSVLEPRPASSISSDSPKACVCKWKHNPNSLCLQVFDTPEALHKHIKTAHVDNCTRCLCHWEGCDSHSKDYKQRSKLSRHLLLHAGYKPYTCSFEGCNKMFATNQAKDNHERTHTGDRPYVCDRCGYTTTTHTQLQTHISALHLGSKKHKCRFCDFVCADSSNLSKHERTHQTLRPYRCPHPGCTFKPDCRWENLKRHFRRSTHCPKLLIEGSEEAKQYRESVKKEIEEWHRRNGDGSGERALSITPRRKGRGLSSE
ncbi:uncharacterized protein BDR25DRAFT_333611 [Lindgomyces ingoldianus]|uniref:Uncharacterized protein n=1 Tax=Lindgomyces ingoldianus TaxID=673940 RepID=A0ACB6R152_9PLEO|nr:uncharacterized protein BDR25DRAFT_333611 [Lindgomyces ingoldianus]KAF2472242.1 hypothetical protein BDR25DRAFT_333611 [Lindgomyces ingoldianus]